MSTSRKPRRAIQTLRKLQNTCDLYKVTELLLTVQDAKNLAEAIVSAIEKMDYKECLLVTFLLSNEKQDSVQLPGVSVERCQVLVDLEIWEDPGERYAFGEGDSSSKLIGFFKSISAIIG